MNQHAFDDPAVAAVFAAYPDRARTKLMALRQLILDTAGKTDGVGKIEETLKWGEPSYIAKKGSTIRIDWKEKLGENYAIYFKCTSLLVPTFKRLYPTEFTYADNRAIHFGLKDRIPKRKLGHCIRLALTYHSIKDALKNGQLENV